MTPPRGVLPVLTEVIEIDPSALPAPAPLPLSAPPLPLDSRAQEAPAAPAVDSEAARQAMAAEFELLLEARVREKLEPELSALIDRSLQSLRIEFGIKAQLLIHQAIDEALAERRKP